MLYFVKDLTKAEQPSQRIDFSQYTKRLDFTGFVYPDKRELIKILSASDRHFIPDLAAAVIAKLQESDYLDSKRIVHKGLICCQDMLCDRGYELSHMQRIVEQDIHIEKEHGVLVAGCQSRRLMRARVNAALRLGRGIPAKFKFVFSGKNPGTAKVRTYNEAIEMQRHFYLSLENEPTRITPQTHTIELDEKSKSTISNVSEFLNGDFIKDDNSDCIFIVSSLFHLLRLSEALDDQIGTSSVKDKIKKVILVGAEDPENPSEVATLPAYIKWMFFDIYDYIYRDNNDEEDRDKAQGNFQVKDSQSIDSRQ